MPDPKAVLAPHNEHELELRLVRLLGRDNGRMLEIRTTMANAIVGQFLPAGSVLKGGSALRFRFGDGYTRNTFDFDATRRGGLDEFLASLKSSLEEGWHGFSGRIEMLPQATPAGVPFDYVMQPLDIRLAYKGKPWCTVRLEISHDEAGSSELADMVAVPEKIGGIFTSLGFPAPSPLRLMTLEHQIAQKLHGASDPSPRNRRAHDLIDLQIMLREGTVDFVKTRDVCIRLFALRRRQPWPAEIAARPGWEEIYKGQKRGLPVLPTAGEAVEWANGLIARIDAAL